MIHSSQKCKGKKRVKKKLFLMMQTKDNWLLSHCNTKKKKGAVGLNGRHTYSAERSPGREGL